MAKIVKEALGMSPPMHLKPGAAGKFDRLMAAAARDGKIEDPEYWANVMEEVWNYTEPSNWRVLKDNLVEMMCGDTLPDSPLEDYFPGGLFPDDEFFMRAFNALKADTRARSRRGSYEF